jgi:predicted metal-dependent hydrolase
MSIKNYKTAQVDGTLDVTLPKVLTDSEKEYIVDKVRRWIQK